MAIKVSTIESGGNPGPAGWNAILTPPAPPNILNESLTADWLIVGGGFAGLAAARRLALTQPGDKIVVLEAIRIGDGASGRNSGFMIDLPHDITADNYAGDVDAELRQTAMNRRALAFSTATAEAYGFGKEIFDPCGKINVAADEKGHHHNEDYTVFLDKMGEPYTRLETADMKRISGSDYYFSGLHTPGTIMIQPAAYIRGMAAGLASDVDIYENSPVVSMRREGNSWIVVTPAGQVTSPKVILAVNGHINSFGFFKRRLMHVFLYASMTRALSTDEIKVLGGESVWSFVPADPMGSTVRRITDASGTRILMRNKFQYHPTVTLSDRFVERAGRDHDRSMAARFPMLKNVSMEYRWAGRLCLSWQSVPAFGEVAENVYSACCQNGLGLSKGVLSGMLAADYAAGVDNPDVDHYLAQEMPSKLPPEPLSWIGATAYLNWKEWRAGKEK